MPAERTYLIFDSNIGKNKPENIVNTDAICPFCYREQLTGIIASDGPILLIENKYPVLIDTFQTVLIETEECNADLSMYSKEHLHRVIRFGIEQWQQMIQRGEFTSVIFYKNHGPYSGGTIRHPHMQIVGLKNVDYTRNISARSLTGAIIHQSNGAELNLAEEPNNGFFEFNIRLKGLQYVNQMADYIQVATHYILNNFYKGCKSYNLFFYEIEGQISAKVVPRFITSPLFIGYFIPQISSRSAEVVEEIKSIYFSEV